MPILSSIGRAAALPVRLSVAAITAGTDAANRVVARLYDRFDAHFSARTRLLRARYASRTDLSLNPPPSLGGVADRADLLTGRDVRAAA